MKASWRKKRFAPLAVTLVAVFAPSPAHAAGPVINATDIFGNVRPSDAVIAPANMGQYTIFPFSRPIRANEAKGRLYVFGNATPGVLIDVTVTDGLGGRINRTFTTQVNDDNDVSNINGDPMRAGDFPDIGSLAHSGIDITDLGKHFGGVHGACETDAPRANAPAALPTDPGYSNCDPTSTSPAHWGPSTLTVKIVARDPFTGAMSAAWTKGNTQPTIVKYAGAPVFKGNAGDFSAPAFSSSRGSPQWPPTNWCHTASNGAQDPIFGLGMGGSAEGSCGTFSPAPDVTWLPAGCWNTPAGYDPIGGAFARSLGPCRNGSANSPKGYALVGGNFVDDPPAAYGSSSEIGSIMLSAVQGTTPLWGPIPNILRSGPIGSYGQSISIEGYEPNFPSGDKYTWWVTARDAWGNQTTIKSGDTTIYPY